MDENWGTYGYVVSRMLELGRIQGEGLGLVIGRIDGERDVLILQGTKKFGTPDEATRKTLERIIERERLEALLLRLLDVSTWEELLADNP